MMLRILPLLLGLMAGAVHAEVAVIVHPGNAAALSSDDIQKLFLGKIKSFPAGGEATPVNLKEGSAVREQFNQGLLGKSESQVKAYWSQLVFTGKGTPPKELDNDEAVKAFVASTPAGVGYIDASKVDGTVKVVLKQ
ncbi:phosphate ABC transporter substrate-binding protein [Permianibacter sp. IMCC34836]|uniref:phosphate ABC transporter substrate-binding protein n=1 Tax=Permianibacter fluminis TaxID=2738515 RepID=UPI0015561513|nr:phosphate ABC transporter substrate-binding protein [Permianibacter fluminis]NQD38114.1 phosphate ABC transporter substrate-binding protein [Permianibacter fluminis]